MPWNLAVFDLTGKIKDARVGAAGLQTWAQRIAAPGVLNYTRFDTQAEVDDGILGDTGKSRAMLSNLTDAEDDYRLNLC
jgi:hypothetical protein